MHQLLAVFTNHETRTFGQRPLCYFCHKPVYPSQQADKQHPSGYVAIVNSKEVVMHGTCDPEK